MCEQEEFKAPRRIAAGAAGDQYTLGTPEVRHHLQTTTPARSPIPGGFSVRPARTQR